MQTNHLQVLENARQKFNQGDVEGYLNELYRPDVTLHYLPPGLPPGYEGARLFYGGFLAGFPDAQLVFDETVVEGDRVAIRFHVDMTHQGEFNGIPPTGKRVSLAGMTVMRFVDGKVAERWSESDFMGLLQQLGVMPAS
jgi:predicted SnoaL-like aldol condensation-catalyzing enzyme